MLEAVAAPYNLDEQQFTLTCSIGGALCPGHGHTADDLVRHAEAAVLAVKDGGRANYRVLKGQRGGDRRADIQLDHAMRQALASSRFRLHYQPQVELSSGRLVGAEALIRWHDPVLGEVSPSRFIPVAEDSGFIVALGDWVLGQAVRQGAEWQRRGMAMPIAINVSALQFQQPQFVDRVAAVLATAGLQPQCLELELTESILVRDADEALQRLQALARIGVRLSIDDFGTGYSSLAYLKRFPIDKLKIDRSFVDGPARCRQRQRHRRGHSSNGPRPGHEGHCRRRGNRSPAPVPSGQRLPRVPGFPVRAGTGQPEFRGAAALVDGARLAGRPPLGGSPPRAPRSPRRAPGQQLSRLPRWRPCPG